MKKPELCLLLLLSLLTFSFFSTSTASHHDQSYDLREKQEWQKGGNNPYVFGEESFEYLVRSEQGKVKVLKPFPELSPLLQGIENYRIDYLETEPLTFVVPTHLDADSIFYVVEGEGAIALLHEGSRESHILEKGDIIRVWAGSIIYLINKSKNQKLKVAKLLQPVGNPGRVQVFYSAGGDQEAESYYQSFSIELLEAALNTRRDRLHQFFASQRSEAIIKAPEEKIRAIAQHSSRSESGPWPFIRSKRPFNLLNKQPSYKNRRGQLYEADKNDYDELKDLNARVSYTDISRGSMLAPFINTRAFKIAVVVKGSGYVEIISPEEKDNWLRQSRREHKEAEPWRQPEAETGRRYRRVSSLLSEGSVFVSPPGHPTAIVASKEQNLQIVCFEVRAENNELVFIAGKNNILSELQEEAKELAFGVPAKMVDEVLRGQEEEVFLAGPSERERETEREEGGKHEKPLRESIMEVVEGF
ncbi:globulin-1 S allele [Dendrobium catenatum]|uniref:globulin-1 S allele n=1 Tax=Dendrobium catenatum TaxID=906689 RepID=UPI00109F700A|nr:globulin-1 S allele [Dendrobium catenatum]